MLDQLENPHLYGTVRDQETRLKMATKPSLTCVTCQRPPRLFSIHEESGTKWIQFHLNYPMTIVSQTGQIKSKLIVIYWKEGSTTITRQAPSDSMKEGFTRSLREAEQSSCQKPTSNFKIFQFWNALQAIEHVIFEDIPTSSKEATVEMCFSTDSAFVETPISSDGAAVDHLPLPSSKFIEDFRTFRAGYKANHIIATLPMKRKRDTLQNDLESARKAIRLINKEYELARAEMNIEEWLQQY